MLVERLRGAWDRQARFRPVHATMALGADGLVLGAGTVLAPPVSDQFGARRIGVDGREARVLTLLSVAYGRRVAPDVLGHIRRASAEWGKGQDCLAAIHLAFSGLPKLPEPRESARRLFMADGLMADGITPDEILTGLEFDPLPDDSFGKLYDQNELRVAPGNGKESGEWTAIGEELETTVEEEEEVGPAIAGVAARILGSTAAAVGTLLYSSSAGGDVSEGEVPGRPDLHYSWWHEDTALTITQEMGTGRITILTATFHPGGVFLDDLGRKVAWVVGEQIHIEQSYFQAPEAREDADDDEPKLCPKPGTDKFGRGRDKDLDYEDYIKKFVNPDNPTKRGDGVQLPNPEDRGRLVFYDDCQRRAGILIEAKGTGYVALMAKTFGKLNMEDEILGDWIEQARRQVAASGGRPVWWFFAEKGAADLAEKAFKDYKDPFKGNLKTLERITIVCAPFPGDPQ